MDKPHFCKSEPDLSGRVREWFAKLPGRCLLEQEIASLESLLPELFGYFLLQVGTEAITKEQLSACRIRQKILLGVGEDAVGEDDIRIDPLRLPIATDSVDVVLLPHTLDFSKDPHQVLREAERVLIPEGRIIIFGFNPWGLWGLWRLLLKRQGKVPWCGQFISQRRLNDWLQLLGLEVEVNRPLMFRPPLHGERLMRRLGFMESLGRRLWPKLSSGYVIQAVSRVSTLTPVGLDWRQAPSQLLRGRVAEPTTRSSSG